MKKSFAENCIRYISTATALILALAMLCCANFSAGAKNLGSNLTITDTTLLLQDINTTTNTTPAKTKDLIASGAGVEILSTGDSITYSGTEIIYFNKNALPSTWTYSYYYAYFYNSTSSRWSDLATHVEDVNGESIYSVTVPNGTWTNIILVNKESSGANWNGSKNQTGNLSLSSGKNYIQSISENNQTATWSTYSGGSSGTTPTTIYYDNSSTKWSKVYAYCWDKDKNYNANWSGVEMTSVGNNIYSYLLPTDKAYISCIFNNGNSGNGNQTGDLTIPTDGKNYYNGNGSEWSTLYTVTFDANGYGTAPSTQYIVSQGTAKEPTAPTETGYTFGGWYTEAECTNEYNFSTAVTGNITLYAKWTAISTTANNRYYVKVTTAKTGWWNNDGCDHVAELSTGTKITLKAVKNDNTASSTSKANGDVYYFDVPTSSTATSFMLLRCEPNTQTAFNDDNKTGSISFVAGKNYLSEFKQKDTVATWGNYTPITISGDTECDVDSTITLTATKTTICHGDIEGISWKSSDNAIARVNTSGVVTGVSEGEVTITAYNTSNENIFATYNVKINTNIVTYTVSFDANGHGTAPSAQTVIENESATEPKQAPTASGYTFGGWYTDKNCTEVNKYNFNTPVTSNLTLYAKWTANEYTVTFDYKDGTTTPTTKVVTYNKAYGPLPAPTRTGYTFNGWYLEEEFNNEVTSTITVTTADNHTLYAKWTAKEYNITYMSDGSQLSDLTPTNYTYGVGVTTLPTNVTKDGYTFKGWYDNEGLTGDAVTSISQEATGDKTFYAKWELNVFKHLYVFLEVSGKDWFYNHSSYGVVSFDGGTTYIDMQELFTNTSTYNSSANKSNLLFAEVPEGTTTIIFSRKNGNVVIDENKTTYTYSQFTTNNLLTLGTGNNTLNGSWSTVDYTPVPVSVTHGENGTVVASKTLADGKTTITVSNSKTKYFDVSTTGISVAVTPSTDYRIKSFTVNSDDKKSVFESCLETGGTYDLGTMSATGDDIQATFEEVPKENPTVKIESESISNSTISFTYTDENNTVQTATAPGSYKVKYKSDISLVISPNPGYHLVSITGLTTESTLPVAGNVTATASQIKADLTVRYELAKNPTVTIEVPANCTVEFAYTNDNGVSTTATTAGTYSVYYGSDISYKVTPNDGFYVATMEGVTNKSPTPPVAGEVTGSIPNITADVTDTITCTLNPNPTVTIECYDSSGNELSEDSGVGITVDGVTGVNTTQTKTVLYKDSTGATFTASVADSHKNNYVFLGYYNTPSAAGNKYANGGYNDHDVTVTDDSIKVYNVCSNRTIYAIFAQLYEVKFSYKNLSTFTVNSEAVANGGAVYVKEGTSLSLATTFDEDYKMTSDCWKISPEGVGAFTRNASNATYVVGNKNVEITITPEIATYTGQGKWGSRLLRIETSGANGDAPWFAAKFEVVKDSNTTYEWVRFSEVKKDNYECVIPDNATRVEFCRMKPDAKAFSTDGVWNVTSTTLGNSDEKYILYFDMTDSSNWVFKCRKDTSG